MEILLGLVLCVFAGLIPAAIYGGFVNWLDRHEKEPWWLLMIAFGWGAVPAIIIAIIAQVLLDIPTTWIVSTETLAYEIVGGSLWAPLTEEIAKGLGVVLIVLLAHRELDNLLDGIIYGAMAGLGFAFTENLLYFGGTLAEDGWGAWAVIVLLRTIPYGLNHAFFSGLLGVGLALAYLSRNKLARVFMPLAGLVSAMVFHGLHNLGASLASQNCASICLSTVINWGGILVLGVIIALIWKQERRWMAEHLAGEVADDVYRLITSWRYWQATRLEALLRGDIKSWRTLGHLRHAATELAFKKQQLASRGEDSKTAQDIQRYRLRLVELGGGPLAQPPAGSSSPGGS